MKRHEAYMKQKLAEENEAATLDGFEYYLQGNIMKYLWRYRYKNGIEDLNKAKWYLDKLISIQGEAK